MYPCRDCGERLNYVYMAHDPVWESAGLCRADYCCIPCLAKRLGRELVPDDFTDATCNWLIKGVNDPGLPKEIDQKFGVAAFLEFFRV